MASYKLPHYARIQIIRERTTPMDKRASASSPRDCAALLTRLIGDNATEELVIVALDGKNRVLATATVAMGGIHSVSCSAADVLRAVLLLGASGFVLAHNHPSGDPTPSNEDVRFTEKVSEAAEVCGLMLVDHLVIASDGYVSMLECGLLDRKAA